MSEPNHRELFELASRIDEVCGRFESAWQAGDGPRLENYLSDVIESERADLLRDLLAIEIELLTKAGQRADEASYCRRFPQYVDVIRGVFTDSSSQTFFGNLRDYELQQKLGEGSMGVVYKALHTRLKRPVAIKTLPPNAMHRAETVSRFHREMEAIGQLDDPHIVRAHDAGEVDGTHYLVMEYVDGLDLRELQERVGLLSIPDACEIVRQAALGLQSAVKAGLVHRDLKPSNMMLTHSGTVKILDLGLAHISSDSDPSAELTSTGQVMGTFDYLAPEQATDTKNIDVRADIYSLGCTLFKMLTGRVPFASDQARTSYQRIRAHLEDPIPSIAAIRAEIPHDLETLLTRMLAKQPTERIQSPEELVQQLTNFATGHDLPALIATAATTTNAEVDTAGASGETITYASGVGSAEPSEAKQPLLSVASDVNTLVGRTPRPSKTNRTDGRGVHPTVVAAIALTLLSIAIAYFSGLLFTVKTADGTIVLQCDPAALKDAKIEIDGEQVQLNLSGDDHPVTIGVDQRRGKLEITKAGFKVFATNFEIAVGNNEQAITVRLEPLPDAADRVAAATAWPPGPAEDVIPGLIPRPAIFPGIKRWQIETKLPRTNITSVDYSPDGLLLAYGTGAGHVRILDAETLELVDLLTDHPSNIETIAWSPDGKWVAYGCGDHAFILNVGSREIGTITFSDDGVTAASSISWAADSSRFAVASYSTVEICTPDGKVATSLAAERTRVVAWSPDGQWIAGGGDDGNVHLWNASDLTRGPTIASQEYVTCIAWSPDSKQLATGHRTSNKIRTWKTDGTLDRVIDALDSNSQTFSLAWAYRGNKLFAASYRITVHDLDDDSKSHILPHYGRSPAHVRLHPDGNHFVSVGASRSIRVCRTDGTLLQAIEDSPVLSYADVQWSHDGKTLACSGDGRPGIWLWNAIGMSQGVIEGAGFPLAWHPSRPQLAGQTDSGVHLWDNSGASLSTIARPDSPVWSMAWSPDGKRLALGVYHGDEGEIELWEPGGKCVATLNATDMGRIGTIAWSPDGKVLVTGGQDAATRFWSRDGTPDLDWTQPGRGFISLAWNPKGHRIAATAQGKTVVWNLDGTPSTLLRNSQGSDYLADWSPDGTQLATCDHMGTVRIWSDEASLQATLQEHDHIIYHVDWSPNGLHIASGASDGTVIVWDAKTHEARWVSVQLPDQESATFSAAGEVIDGSPALIEEHFAYIVENEDGSRELLKHSEFQKRIQPQLTDSDPHRSLAEWVIEQGGSVDVRHGQQLDRRVAKVQDLPISSFTVDGVHIVDTADFGDQELQEFAKLRRAASGSSQLYLTGTSVTDAGLHHLQGLELLMLNIVGPSVTDAGLPALRKLRRLNSLGLPFTSVTSEGMKTIAELDGLLSLNLFSTAVDDEALLVLRRLPNLQAFTLSETKVTDAGMESLAAHENLAFLQLIHCDVGDSGMMHIRKLTNLKSLDLYGTRVTDVGLRSLSPLKKLKHLALNGCDVSDGSLSQVDEWFPDLEDELTIQSTKAGDGALQSIGQLRKLKVLYANTTRITDTGLKYLEEMTQLQHLDIRQTQVTKAAITQLHTALPACRIEWDGGVIEPK